MRYSIPLKKFRSQEDALHFYKMRAIHSNDYRKGTTSARKEYKALCKKFGVKPERTSY